MTDQQEASLPDREGCWCKSCHRELDPRQPRPCPYCGAPNRIYQEFLRAAIGVRASTEMKQLRKGFKRALVEMIDNRWRADHFGKRRKGILENRVIDRLHDKYDHTLKDVETGEVFHDEHVTLSEHRTKSGDKK